MFAAFALLWPAIVPFRAPARQDAPATASEEIVRQLAALGVRVDLDRGLIELDAKICQRYEPLEYLLIAQPRGKDHEALLSVDKVDVMALNTAMLLLGLEPGRNGQRVAADPPPTQEEYEAGVPLYSVKPAEGDGLYLYVSWEETSSAGSSEPFFYRAEDLVVNARAERSYARGKWIYLGSRFIRPHRDAPELFAADAEGNLISLCYFHPANHLLTGADPEADDQYVWFPNFYLLPEIGHPVKLLLSRALLESPPPSVGGAQ